MTREKRRRSTPTGRCQNAKRKRKKAKRSKKRASKKKIQSSSTDSDLDSDFDSSGLSSDSSSPSFSEDILSSHSDNDKKKRRSDIMWKKSKVSSSASGVLRVPDKIAANHSHI
ncbi:hypothetical protein CF335_g4945 [Tilletia laevis]|nr:hypothetical protein CF335_g4945 [Tilletia laevis]